MKTPAIDVKNVSKNFLPSLSFSDIFKGKVVNRKPQTALNDVTFRVMPQKLVAILGENGAGKTTLLNILSSLVIPDSGVVKINNLELNGHELEIKSHIGVMSSVERSFYWRLTGRQNLYFFAALYNLNRNEAEKRIDFLLDKFQVNYSEKRFSDYSTGMKKIFSLIRALLHSPQILLLDEPDKSLDLNNKLILLQTIRGLKAGGKTILISTHNFNFVSSIADEYLILHKAKLKAQGTLNDMQQQLSSSKADIEEIYLRAVKND